MKTYTRLALCEREEISRGIWAREKFARIAERINRPTSAVSREVGSNVKRPWCYRAEKAQKRADELKARGRSKKLDIHPCLRDYVYEKLRQEWSPEEIAKRMRLEYPDDKMMRVSHETIYQHLYCLPRGELKKELMIGLRQERSCFFIAPTGCLAKLSNRHLDKYSVFDNIIISLRKRPC